VDLLVANLAERPDLAPLLDGFPGVWPEFLSHDPVTASLYDTIVAAHPQFSLIAVHPGAPDIAVAKACGLPLHRPDGVAGRLPDGGYDAVLLAAAADLLTGRPGTVAAAVEVVVRPEMRGTGVSTVVLGAVRRNAARLGYRDLVVPVRPNRKHEDPDSPLHEYVSRTRPDGLPRDPWLRVHVRAGGRMLGVAPSSMTVSGTLDEWRAWTGLPFDADGPVRVPDALTPVLCDVARDRAVYVEPNVWVHHRL
jgi:GNAT superfamily N-acetyltransferase